MNGNTFLYKLLMSVYNDVGAFEMLRKGGKNPCSLEPAVNSNGYRRLPNGQDVVL